MTPRALVVSTVLAALLLGAACSSDPPGPACAADGTPAGFVATTPTTRFSADVMPIFQQSCAFSTCHGVENNPNGVYLGTDAKTVYANLVGQKAVELPTMSYVAAGDPTQSFLMHKMDDTLCTLDAQCTGGSCGSLMPQGNQVLQGAVRDTIRRWIAQGAKND